MKNKTAWLITPLARNFPIQKDADYIGVDAGFVKILEKGLPLAKAIGDFDSLQEGSLPDDAIILPVKKDETDSEMAMQYAVNQGYSNIILWGGLEGRLDHTLANIRLIVWDYPEVVLMDENQKAFVLKQGLNLIEPEYKHLSFFAMEPSVVSEKNVMYELDHAKISQKDMFTTSNSFLSGPAEITVHEGKVLCVLSRLV